MNRDLDDEHKEYSCGYLQDYGIKNMNGYLIDIIYFKIMNNHK